MDLFIVALIAAFNFNPIASEYIAISHHRTNPPNPCSLGGTALVEKFFNFIFAEFQSNPPVCVCVQMCADQPTYCYPNGCLKRLDTPKKDKEPSAAAAGPIVTYSQVLDNSKPAAFLVPGSNDRFVNPQVLNLANEKNTVKTEKSLLDDMRPNPFNDRFISLFKYRKTPRVHLRYNLREQVKNTKSDRLKIEKVDTPNNKWAKTINYKPLSEKKPLLNDDPFDDASFKIPPSLPRPVIENKISAQSRYFKRELAKLSEVKKSNDIQNTTENSALLLDNIIENLIENNFQPFVNETDLDFDIDLIYPVDNITNEVTISKKRYLPILEDYSKMVLNETTDVISLNLTNENKDQNVYKGDSNIIDTFKNIYNEMIENMSKRIDTKNNSSAEYLKMIGKQLEDVTESSQAIDKETTTRTTQVERAAPTTVVITELTTTKRTTHTEHFTDTTSINTTPQHVEEKEVSNLKKSRQKLTRKMQNGKLNQSFLI